MSISEEVPRRPEALIIHRPSSELMAESLESCPLSTNNWDASFIFDASRIPRFPASEFLKGLEDAGIVPYTFLNLKFNSNLAKFEPLFMYGGLVRDSVGLRQLTREELDLEQKPQYYFFLNQNQRAFEVLRRDFMEKSLTSKGYVLGDAQIFSGRYGRSDYLSITSNGIGLYGGIANAPLRDVRPIISSEKEGDVRNWFKGLKAKSVPPSTHTMGTKP